MRQALGFVWASPNERVRRGDLNLGLLAQFILVERCGLTYKRDRNNSNYVDKTLLFGGVGLATGVSIGEGGPGSTVLLGCSLCTGAGVCRGATDMWKSNLQAIALRSTIGLFGLVSCAPASAHMPQDTNVLDLRVLGLKEVPRASSPPAVLKGVVDYMVRPPAPPSVFDSVAAVRSVVGSGNACAPLPQGQLQQARDRGCVSPDSYLCAPIQGAAADSVCQVEMNEMNALPLVGGSSWLIAGDKVWGPFGGVNQVALHHAFAANGRLYVMFDSASLIWSPNCPFSTNQKIAVFIKTTTRISLTPSATPFH